MHDVVDTRMNKQKFYLIAGFTAAVLGFVMLSFVFLKGWGEILYAGAVLMCLAAAVQSVGKPVYLVPAGCSPVITRPDIYCYPENPGHNPVMTAGISQEPSNFSRSACTYFS
jgi:hypothetical protein